MVRPCAKYARLNCYAPTNKRQQKTAVVCLSACPAARCAVFFLTWCMDRQARSNFSRHALTPLRGRFFGLGSKQNNKDKRTEIVRFHNVAEGDISRSQREHFTASASCHVSKIFVLNLLTKITSFLKRFRRAQTVWKTCQEFAPRFVRSFSSE